MSSNSNTLLSASSNSGATSGASQSMNNSAGSVTTTISTSAATTATTTTTAGTTMALSSVNGITSNNATKAATTPRGSTPTSNNVNASSSSTQTDPEKKKGRRSLSITELPSADLTSFHLQLFCQDVEKMLDNPFLSDVTLAVGTPPQNMKAHRALLAARCEYFHNLFHSNMREANEGILHFPEKNPADFKVLLTYFYSAKVNINHDNAFGVLKLADEFDIRIIKEKCIQYVKKFINEDNVFDVLEEARFCNFIELHSFCKSYLEKNAKSMFNSESFLTVSKDTLIDLLASDKIHLSELEIFLSVIEWGKYQIKYMAHIIQTKKNLDPTKRKRKSSLVLKPKKKLGQSSNTETSKKMVDGDSKDGSKDQKNNDTKSSNINQSNNNVDKQDSKSHNKLSEHAVIKANPDNKHHVDEKYLKNQYNNVKSISNVNTYSLNDEDQKSLVLEQGQRLSISEQSSPSHMESYYDQYSENETTCTELNEEEEEDEDEIDNNIRIANENLLSSSSNPHISTNRTTITTGNTPCTPTATISTSTGIIENSVDPLLSQQKIEVHKKRVEQLLDYVNDKQFVKQLKNYLSDVLPYIRFPILNPHEIYDYVEPTQVVPKELLLEAYRSHALSNRFDIQDSPRLKVREGSLYYVPGVQENVSLKLLRGWVCCYRKPYSDKTSEQVFDLVQGTRILVGARHKNSPNLALCAMGTKAKVLKETFENETVKENGTYWYHWKNHSFGFSNIADINLGSADLAPGTHKLSWHLTGRGGYRCGEIKNLNESDEWEKIIFYA